jgi:hypothetical protein
MIIAAHIQQTKGYTSFLLPFISRIANEHPMVQFILFCENTNGFPTLAANCTMVVLKRSLKNSLLLHYWLNYTLPALLTKYKATLFISENNTCSLRTELPQLMLIKQNLTTVIGGGQKGVKSRYLQKYFNDFATKATKICTVSPLLEKTLTANYPVLENKISTIYHSLDECYQPKNELQKTEILATYTEGFHFFLCECNTANRTQLVTVLKAFSIFKKRLKSSLQLLLINKLEENPIADFHLYKYRQEVKILTGITRQQEADLLASAYAAIEIPGQQLSDWGLLCMKCETPLITADGEYGRIQYEDAAMFVELKETALADELMRLYKDESYRSLQIAKGIKLAEPYTLQHSSHLLWQTILQCSKE